MMLGSRLTHTAETAESEPRTSEVQMATDWMHLRFVGTHHIHKDMIQPPDTKCVPKSTHLNPFRTKSIYMNGGKSPSKYLFITSVINWQQHQLYSSDTTVINGIHNSYQQPSVKVSPLQTNLLAIVSVHCNGTAVEERRGPDWVRDYENQNTVTNSSVVLVFSRYWMLHVSTYAVHFIMQSQHSQAARSIHCRRYRDARLGWGAGLNFTNKRTKWKPK